MAYNILLAERVRKQLEKSNDLQLAEKKMFRGLTFMVNGKMCISVSGENLMCRFDPAQQSAVAAKPGFLPMIMKNKKLNGYCYVTPVGFNADNDFADWVNLCLDFNARAQKAGKASKRKAIIAEKNDSN